MQFFIFTFFKHIVSGITCYSCLSTAGQRAVPPRVPNRHLLSGSLFLHMENMAHEGWWTQGQATSRASAVHESWEMPLNPTKQTVPRTAHHPSKPRAGWQQTGDSGDQPRQRYCSPRIHHFWWKAVCYNWISPCTTLPFVEKFKYFLFCNSIIFIIPPYSHYLFIWLFIYKV